MLRSAQRLHGTLVPAGGRSQTAARQLKLIRPTDDVAAASSRARRVLNVGFALLALIVLSPLMLLIAVAVKLSSPGPVIFRQPRVGMDRRRGPDPHGRRRVDLGGRIFTIYKFRTMRAGSGDRQVWASPADERVTAVGRFLRKYRLDELPQLVNVLQGDMNVVGPRPEQPAIFAELREHVDRYPVRQRVLPGITGWAQVNHCYDRCIEDVKMKVKLDLDYLRRASVLHDMEILVRTVPVVLLRKGAW
jgi:lipopolysaccharide/colanic/teichoic acid biosynthesis glycosyltransferase